MDVIDVTVVGGPDVAAVVGRDGPLLRIAVQAGDAVPAVVERVVVVIETAPVRHVVAPSPGADFSGRPVADVRGPWAATDQGCVAWLGAAVHLGEVVVKADGWLVSAVAHLGVLLGPGERLALDPLFVGASIEEAVAAWAATAGRCRPLPDPGVPSCADAPPCDPWPADGDLSRPGALVAVEAAGATLAGEGWVTVAGADRVLSAPSRWGATATTPVADLRAGVCALRRGLGAAPVLHLAGAPPAVAAGVADVVDATDAWAPFDGVLWHRAAPHGPGA